MARSDRGSAEDRSPVPALQRRTSAWNRKWEVSQARWRRIVQVCRWSDAHVDETAKNVHDPDAKLLNAFNWIVVHLRNMASDAHQANINEICHAYSNPAKDQAPGQMDGHVTHGVDAVATAVHCHFPLRKTGGECASWGTGARDSPLCSREAGQLAMTESSEADHSVIQPHALPAPPCSSRPSRATSN
ncbi:hypothetical protein AAFF_G00126900 [Aldrovandia affinis]|uniref:Uncharacterized protein n=1 Tax=Aldrovandia affinis TaxID=143900 RepID=A0AAD7T0W2_9TELE|nr:hypothetical protein AAFF_G00126900 [Aldrovandia affinis]